MSERVRLDVWIWAVRLVKTRAAATEACRGGHVKLNGSAAKAAQPVRVGDEVRGLLEQDGLQSAGLQMHGREQHALHRCLMLRRLAGV